MLSDAIKDSLPVNDIDPTAEHPATSKDTLAPIGSPKRPASSNIPMFSSSPSRRDPVPISAPAPLPPTDDPEYVWDVFYHRAGLADDYEEKPNVNIATLCASLLQTNCAPLKFVRTGLPASFDDPDSSDDESELEDEADEDSNGTITLAFSANIIQCPSSTNPAEEYYKNDYPEEDSDDSGSSGMFKYLRALITN
jgi:hypothetical protein